MQQVNTEDGTGDDQNKEQTGRLLPGHGSPADADAAAATAAAELR